ncbi:hypothetical protein BH24GEM2_BH24GEM2_16290 [soil metagenome]|jgi:hypothetical protein
MAKLTDPLVRAALVGVLVPPTYWAVFTLLFPGMPVTHGAGVGAAIPLAFLEYRRSKRALS